MSIIKTAERVSLSPSDNFVFQRSLLAYKEASRIVHGKVLEIGTGSGYGVQEISPNVQEFWTLDKHYIPINYNKFSNTRFIKNKVPPLTDMPDNYFDFVLCFQVIEHIKDSDFLLKEIKRVLKDNGKLIISTPNKKKSLTKNPWHVREYTDSEFSELLSQCFSVIETKGIQGSEKVNLYYHKNKMSVQKIMRFDVFNLSQILPRWILKYPYDLANRINRIFLLKNNPKIAISISLDDYSISEMTNDCFDLFYIAENKSSM